MFEFIFGFGILVFIFVIWAYVRILHKAGYSGWWVLILCIPIVNVIMIWVFAFADWPNLRKRKKLEQSQEST